jgi:hypothetical protein
MRPRLPAKGGVGAGSGRLSAASWGGEVMVMVNERLTARKGWSNVGDAAAVRV